MDSYYWIIPAYFPGSPQPASTATPAAAPPRVELDTSAVHWEQACQRVRHPHHEYACPFGCQDAVLRVLDYDWRIGYAWSDDPDGLIGPSTRSRSSGLDRGTNASFDTNNNVVFDGFGYHLWYTTDEYTAGAGNIAYAVSPDGIEWTRYPWNPVVGGGSGPCAVLRDQDSGEYTMWYTDCPGFSIRRATSECCPGVFYDGFEFGDTAGWTVTVP